MGKTSKLSLISSSKKTDVLTQKLIKKNKKRSNDEKKNTASKDSPMAKDVLSVEKITLKHSKKATAARIDESIFFFQRNDREFFSGKTMSSLINEAYDRKSICVFAEVHSHVESRAPNPVFYADAEKILGRIIRLSDKKGHDFRNELFDFSVVDVDFVYSVPYGAEKEHIISVSDMISSSRESWAKQSYLSAIIRSGSHAAENDFDNFADRALSFSLFSMGKFVQKNSRVAELIVQRIDDEKKEMAFTRALSRVSLFSTPDVVRFLISNGADSNPIGFDWNNYPLGNAAMVNNIETLKELLKHGADPDYREPDFNPSPLEAGFNPSPLELAESRGYKEAVDLMRENQKNKQKEIAGINELHPQ